jgi:hypothetical protein
MFLQRLRITARCFAPAFRGGALAVAVAAACLVAPHVLAQGTGGTGGSTTTSAGGIRVTLISIGDRDAHIGQNWIGINDCKNDVDVQFKVDGAPRAKPSIDIYMGESCNSTQRNNTANVMCTFLANAKAGVTMGLILHVKAGDLIKDCDKAEESKPKLWFLAVDTSESTEDVGNAYGVVTTLGLDTRPPAAPTNVTGGEGEHEIPVTWDSGETNLKGFKVYIDPHPGAPGSMIPSGASGSSGATDEDDGGALPPVGTGDGGTVTGVTGDGGTAIGATNAECPSSSLVSGAAPDMLPSSIKQKTINKPTATEINLIPGDIDSSSSTTKDAAIAVVAVDLAENESPLSVVACVHVEPTTAFWDRYRMEGGDAKAGCPCSAMGEAQIESAWPVGFAVIMLGLSAHRRRRS